MMTLANDVRHCLNNLGFSEAAVRTPADGLAVDTNLCTFHVMEADDHVQLECRLMGGVQRNKLALWNILHHNNAFVPFGQFYISPDDNICFGFRLAEPERVRPWLNHIVYQLMLVAEAYFRLVVNDFKERPWDEQDVRIDPNHLFRTELVEPDDGEFRLTQSEVAAMLHHQLIEMAGADHVMRVGELEFALTGGDFPVSVTLEHLPELRRQKHDYPWLIGLQTEVGVLRVTDDKLWVRMNRLNFQSFMMSHAISYANRKPMVTLRTALIPPLIQQPEIVRESLLNHSETAPRLFAEFEQPYRIMNVLDFKLGLHR